LKRKNHPQIFQTSRFYYWPAIADRGKHHAACFDLLLQRRSQSKRISCAADP